MCLKAWWLFELPLISSAADSAGPRPRFIIHLFNCLCLWTKVFPVCPFGSALRKLHQRQTTSCPTHMCIQIQGIDTDTPAVGTLKFCGPWGTHRTSKRQRARSKRGPKRFATRSLRLPIAVTSPKNPPPFPIHHSHTRTSCPKRFNLQSVDVPVYLTLCSGYDNFRKRLAFVGIFFFFVMKISIAECLEFWIGRLLCKQTLTSTSYSKLIDFPCNSKMIITLSWNIYLHALTIFIQKLTQFVLLFAN